MTLPEKSEILRRFDQVGQRLDAALAFSRLLVELGAEEAHQLVEEAQRALAKRQEERGAIQLFVGRKALRRVREAEIGCAVLLERLAERDRTVPPASLRQHLRRRLGANSQQLIDLLAFYLLVDSGGPWDSDRVDKVDLLITRLSQRFTDSSTELDPERLRRVLRTLPAQGPATITRLEREAFEANLAGIQAGVEAADSLSQLLRDGTLQRYRDLKHRIGHLLLHPELLQAVIETNQQLQRKIERLNSRTLTGIFSTYQSIFDTGLKGRISPALRQEIDQLGGRFDQFEQRIKQREIRLTELEEFWSTLREISTRVDEAAVVEPPVEQPAEHPPTGMPAVADASEDWLTEDLMALLDLLREHDSKGWPADFVALSPGEEFELDPREIVAFRRLSKDEPIDRDVEMFLLKGAALRRCIKRSARALAKVSDVEIARELPVFAIARQAAQLAESFLTRYSQAVGRAILDGDAEEAQKLQLLRMRLVRESAGIWLQVHQQG